LRAEIPFEVLVIDNAPRSDATRVVVEGTPGVRYLCEPLVGLDFARNCAMREATGEVLAFLDDDVVVDWNWARGLLRAWGENPDAGAVTGLVLPLALETPAQVLFEQRGGFRRGFLPLRYGPTAFRDPLHPCGAGQFGTGANMSIDLSLLRKLGGFDEALDTGRPLPGGGDLDIFYRVLRAGRMLVYDPRAVVFHEHRRELVGLRRQYHSWGVGLMAFLVKSMRSDRTMRPALRRLVLWWFKYQLRRIFRRLRRREPTPLRMIAAEILGGVQGLLGEYRRSERRSAAIRARVS
jgi:GT2 family glycosyltransferase